MFELVNEPHDLDVTLWAGTVQAAIDAIRAAGATSQTILIPGTEYTHLDAWTDGSDDALLVSGGGISDGLALCLAPRDHRVLMDLSNGLLRQEQVIPFSKRSDRDV
jgi:hypothetical protein